jgi:hypothetical protein
LSQQWNSNFDEAWYENKRAKPAAAAAGGGGMIEKVIYFFLRPLVY